MSNERQLQKVQQVSLLEMPKLGNHSKLYKVHSHNYLLSPNLFLYTKAHHFYLIILVVIDTSWPEFSLAQDV